MYCQSDKTLGKSDTWFKYLSVNTTLLLSNKVTWMLKTISQLAHSSQFVIQTMERHSDRASYIKLFRISTFSSDLLLNCLGKTPNYIQKGLFKGNCGSNKTHGKLNTRFKQLSMKTTLLLSNRMLKTVSQLTYSWQFVIQKMEIHSDSGSYTKSFRISTFSLDVLLP